MTLKRKYFSHKPNQLNDYEGSERIITILTEDFIVNQLQCNTVTLIGDSIEFVWVTREDSEVHVIVRKIDNAWYNLRKMYTLRILRFGKQHNQDYTVENIKTTARNIMNTLIEKKQEYGIVRGL